MKNIVISSVLLVVFGLGASNVMAQPEPVQQTSEVSVSETQELQQNNFVDEDEDGICDLASQNGTQECAGDQVQEQARLQQRNQNQENCENQEQNQTQQRNRVQANNQNQEQTQTQQRNQFQTNDGECVNQNSNENNVANKN